MGILQSSSDNFPQKKSNLISKGYVKMYHFGEVEIFYDQNSHLQYFKNVYEFIIEADSEYMFMSKLLQNNNECPFLINMMKIESKDQNFCSNTKSIHVYLQYLPNTLQSILNGRTQPFPQCEVILLMSSLLEAIKFMNQHQTYHGDLSPEEIFFDQRTFKRYVFDVICRYNGNSYHRYKIFDSAYFNPMKHGYYRAFEQKIYCAPEILSNLSERRTFPLYNHYVCDTFSIGLIVLYCMTLVSPLGAYKNNNKEFDYYYIEMLLRIASKHQYSQALIHCVSECVMLKNRPTAAEVLSGNRFLKVPVSESNKLSLRK